MRWVRVGETQIVLSWHGSRDTRTAVSPARGGMGDWTNHRQRLPDRGRGFKKKGKYFVKHGTSDKDGNGCRPPSIASTPSKRRHKTFNEENKQFDPGEQGEKARLGTRLYSTFFSGKSWEAPCCFLFVLRALCSVCVGFPKLFFFHRRSLLSEAERWDAGSGRGSSRRCTQPEAKRSLA